MAGEANSPMFIDTGTGHNFGGLGMLGGGIVGYALGAASGGGWGWGGNRFGGATAVADASLANAIEHVSDQVTQGTIASQQLASNQNMFMGNLINQTGDQITGAITQGTFTGMQNTQAIGDKLCGINNNITVQGYESRLQSQALAAQMQQQCCQLSREIYEQGCQNRELQRQIQTEAITAALADAKATNATLLAQINLSQTLGASQNAQTAQILAAINALSASTAARANTAANG